MHKFGFKHCRVKLQPWWEKLS